MGKATDIVNEVLSAILARPAVRRVLPEVVGGLGEALACERVRLWVEDGRGACTSAHEWRAGGSSLGAAAVLVGACNDPAIQCLRLDGRDLALVRDEGGLASLGIARGDSPLALPVVVMRLGLASAPLGILLLEGARRLDVLEDGPGLELLRNVLSALALERLMLDQSERASDTDLRTAAGTRAALYRHLASLDAMDPVGFACLGWRAADAADEASLTHADIAAVEILHGVFGQDAVFAIGDHELLVVCPQTSREDFGWQLGAMRRLLLEHGLSPAVGDLWLERHDPSLDDMVRRVVDSMREDAAHIDVAGVRPGRQPATRQFFDLPDRIDGVAIHQGARFFEACEEWLAGRFEEKIVSIAANVNYFRLYTDIFGREQGRRLLVSVACTLARLAKRTGGIVGYLESDDFCLMYPAQGIDEGQFRALVEAVEAEFSFPDGFSPMLGIYICENRGEGSMALYDHAAAALSEIRGSYTERYNLYNGARFLSVREEKQLLTEARQGLERGDFFFCLQPQVNERTGKVVGAEALVRWNHGGQVLEPGRFISEMERNGFIYELDRHVWQQVCAWLRAVIDRGVRPLPISVNISRVDFFFSDVVEELVGLVERYGISPDLLRLEITETAFTDNLQAIVDVTRRLRERGFHIYIDDFGSGSSSLNMLCGLDVDGLKTDIGFITGLGQDDRASSIVESIISMAHLIGLTVVAEGVETAEQREALLMMGDTYAQGFYFYPPLSTDEFERMLGDPRVTGADDESPAIISRLPFRDLMLSGVIDETILDSIVGPAAVYREQDGVISIVCMNEPYSRLTGIGPDDHEAMDAFIRTHYRPGDDDGVREAFLHADHSPAGVYSEGVFRRDDGSTFTQRGRIYLLYSYKGHRLFLATILQG